MTRNALATLIHLAASRRDAAGAQLAQAARQRDASVAQLDLLRNFRTECEAHLAARGDAGLSAERLRTWRAFLDKLDGAIHEQSSEAASREARLDACTGSWMKEELRKRSFEVLKDQRERAENTARARQEQKVLDDIAQRTSRIAPQGA